MYLFIDSASLKKIHHRRNNMTKIKFHCASHLYNGAVSRYPPPNTNTSPSTSSPLGAFELRITERYVLKCQPKDDAYVVLEDVTSPEFCFLFYIPLQFPTPLSRTLYIKNMVSSLNLDPYVCEFVRAEVTDCVAETLGKSEGKEAFQKMLAVQVTKVEFMGKEETAWTFNQADFESDNLH